MKKGKIKLVVFDMDGVIFDVAGYNEKSQKVTISNWHAVFDHIGIFHEHTRLKNMFIKGELSSYMEWTDKACRVLQKHGLTKDKFYKIVDSRPFMKGAKETFRKLKERKCQTAVITGGFKALADKAQKVLGLDHVIAHCNFSFSENGEIEGWELTPCDFEGKVKYFNKLISELELNPSECVYVGDGINDIPLLEKVGLGIAFNCSKEDVRKAAHVVIGEKDLREILVVKRLRNLFEE